MYCHRLNQQTRRKPRRVSRPRRPAKHPREFYAIASATAGLLLLCMMAGLGCSSDKREVEHVALQFVEGIKNGDAETLERIIDWERWYSVHSPGDAPGAGAGDSKHDGQEAKERIPDLPGRSSQDKEMLDDLKEQKDMLLTVLSTDRVLALRYLTAEHVIKRVSVKGPEALVQISQEDRATGERRLLTLQLHRDPDAGWRIYKFLSEELEAT